MIKYNIDFKAKATLYEPLLFKAIWRHEVDRLTRIRGGMLDRGLDAVLITDEKNQRYATGFAFTDGAVLVTLDRAFLFTDSRYIEAAERAVSHDITLRQFGAGSRLSELVRQAVGECGAKAIGAEEGTLPHGEFLRWEELLGTRFLPCQSLFSGLRAAKDEAELRCMRRAQSIAEAALEYVLAIIRPGITERDIAAEITYRLLKHGGEGVSFDPIAVTGTNSSMPHGVPSDAVVQAGDFVTMDFGCVKDGYCSDMTRTVAVGHATDEMKNVYDIVLRAQLAGIGAAAAGVTGREIDSAARKVISDAGYGEYFGHSFGHSLGLDIHEAPNASPSDDTPMPVGAVISAEPGIYLPGKFGVRIEDVLILRDGGCEDITKAEKSLLIV